MITQDINKLRQISSETTLEECENSGIFERLEIALQESGKQGISGVGLSGIQIEEPVRACIVRINYGKESKKEPLRINMINPVIEDSEDLQPFTNEGCLSFPGLSVMTDRYQDIVCSWLDFDSKKEKRASFCGIEAIVVQHELDHMNGVVLLDRKHQKVESIGRNEQCPCGSGKKYKKCCLK